MIEKIGAEDRLAMSNMAIEAGGKAGIIAPDEITLSYLNKIAGIKLPVSYIKNLKSDRDAKYSRIVEIDVTNMEPQVACPHSPANVRPVSALKAVKLQQVIIGSCTNGRIGDLKIAAKIIKGKPIARGVRVVVIPATPDVYLQAEKEGLLKIFASAGCAVSSPTCGSCLGGHMGILDKGETAIATTNRNFIGRMGSPESFVYLSSPAVAAASAIKGRIAHPDEIR